LQTPPPHTVTLQVASIHYCIGANLGLDRGEAALDHEHSALVNLARATLAVDQLAAVPGFHTVAMGDALDALKAEFVQAHEARREAEELA